jgi:peptide/nickel transport system substrate-binding protein
MKSRSRKLLVAVATIAVAGLLTACGGSPGGGMVSGDSPRAETNELVLLASDDPGTLDYVTSNLTALALWIPGNVVETLLSRGADGVLAAGLAAAWEANDDATVYDFHLREATFSDGSPVTADDVVYSLNTMMTSPVGLNKAPYAAVTDIVALDDRTVQVSLSRPSLSFIEGMAGGGGMIQPEAAAASIATKPIGSGPYVVDEYVTGNRLVFTKNESYWAEPASIDRVEVRFVNEATAALNALKANEADGYPFVGQDLWERIGTEGLDKSMTLETFSQGGTIFFLNFNSNEAPYDDPALRHAIVKSIDRQSIVDLFNAPWGLVATCDHAAADTGSVEDCVDPYDPEEAKAELEDAGYAGAAVDLTTVTDIGNLVGPSDVVAASLQAVGLDVERNQLDLARYSQIVFSGTPPQYGLTVMTTEYDLSQMASCPDPSKAGWKTYCDAEITQILADADAARTPEDRDALIAEAQQKLQEDAVIVPLLAAKGVGLLNSGLQGWGEPKVTIAIDLARLHW